LKKSVLALLLLVATTSAGAADGPVALQTADPSCRDDSGDIYVDCDNGTVTDNRTGLVWLKNPNCLVSGVTWYTAMELVAGLSDKPPTSEAADEDCGLSDGSSPGEWRLPSAEEWEAMIADAVQLGCVFGNLGGPSITNDAGTGCWESGDPGSSFTGVGVNPTYWSSTTRWLNPGIAWSVSLDFGDVNRNFGKSAAKNIWPVRGGQ
jgi:hypothetical protein